MPDAVHFFGNVYHDIFPFTPALKKDSYEIDSDLLKTRESNIYFLAKASLGVLIVSSLLLRSKFPRYANRTDILFGCILIINCLTLYLLLFVNERQAIQASVKGALKDIFSENPLEKQQAWATVFTFPLQAIQLMKEQKNE